MCGNESQPGLKPSRKSGYAPDNHLETLGFPHKTTFLFYLCAVMPESLLNLLSKVDLMSTCLDVHFKRTSVSGVNRPNVGD